MSMGIVRSFGQCIELLRQLMRSNRIVTRDTRVSVAFL